MPIRVKKHWFHPVIYTFYNKLSDKEIDNLKELAKPLVVHISERKCFVRSKKELEYIFYFTCNFDIKKLARSTIAGGDLHDAELSDNLLRFYEVTKNLLLLILSGSWNLFLVVKKMNEGRPVGVSVHHY